MTDGKHCSRCKEFKSAGEFYRQGNRLESVCKQCKQKARNQRQQKKDQPSNSEANSELSIGNKASTLPQSDFRNAGYEELGLTREDFIEVVGFFRELIRIDQKEG